MNWLLPIILATSVSVRSPNVQPNPFDYQIQFAVQKSDYFYVSRTWERELGIEYVDEEYCLTRKTGEPIYLLRRDIEVTIPGFFSFQEKYIKKTSRDLEYNQLDMRYGQKGFSVGYALKHIESELKPTHNLIFGYKIKDRSLDILILKFKLNSHIDFATDFGRLDISTKTELAFSLLQNLDLVCLYRYESLGNNKFYQYKLGLNFEITRRG